jgi:hypothetical protein
VGGNDPLEEPTIRTGDAECTHLLINICVARALTPPPAVPVISRPTVVLGTPSQLLCLLVALMNLLKRASKWFTLPDDIFGIGVGNVFVVSGDCEHEYYHEELDDVPDDNREEEIREIVLTSEQHDILRNDSDDGCNPLTELYRNHIAIVDVCEFMGDDVFKLAAIKQLDEFSGDDDSPVTTATDCERIRHTHVSDL